MSSPSRAAASSAARLVLAAALVAVAASPASAQFFNCGATCHVVSGNVSDGAGGPFLAGHVYLANSGLNVLAGTTLTIQPGAIVKFGGIYTFSVSGTLLANGTSGAPILLTSIHDDTGGDHNGNAGGSGLAAGQWVQLLLDGGATASQVSYVEIRGAGWNGNSAIRVTGGSPTFSGCVVSSPGGPCIDLGNASTPNVVGCSFVGGTKAAVGVPISSLPGFSACVATGQTQRDAPELSSATVTGSTAISVDDTFNGSGVVVAPLAITVNPGASLTLGAGVVVKLDGVHAINCYGTLNVAGSTGTPAVLTSIHDDAFGGDTNRNTNGSALAPGQWVQLYLGPDSDASAIASLRIRGAGWNGNPAVRLDGSNAALGDVRVSVNGGPGLDLSNNSYPTAANCAFDGGTKAVVGVRLPAFAGFSGCTATGNSVRNVPEVSSPALGPGETAVITAGNALNGDGVLSVVTTLTVDTTASLSLGGGVKIKFDGVQTINCHGTLITTGSAGNPVVLTSIHDDVHGGDSNLNLAGSSPAPGQWVQLWLGPSSDASSLQHVLVRCAGWNGNSGVLFNQSNATAVGLRTQLCGGPCLGLSNNSTPTLTGCAFDGGTVAAVDVPPAAVAGFSGCTAAGNSQRDAALITVPVVGTGENLTWAKSASFNANGVFVVTTTMTVQGGGALTLGPGVTLKFEGVFALNCYGTLTTNGTLADPTTLTSIHDDAVGGDTNKNASGSSLAPGQWVQLYLAPSASASALSGLRVRCAGWNGNASVRLDGCSPTLTDVRTAVSGGPCLDLSNNAAPSASFCAFDGGNYAATNVPLTSLAGFKQCTAVGNSAANAPRVTSGTIPVGQTAKVRAINGFNGNGVVHVAAALTVNGTLDAGPGTAFKFESVIACNVYGTALLRGSGLEPVVFTSIHDDAVGGDTNVNGGGSSAAPGQWLNLYFDPAASGVAERVHVRFAGWNGNRAVDCASAAVYLNAVRVDRSGGPGLYVGAAAGATLDHCAAWGCSGEGVRVVPTKVVRHATVANCGGVGIATSSGASTAINSIAWGNGGAGFAGFAAGAVTYSCAAGLTTGVGNVTTDPQFVSAATGDLTLQTSSPCVDVAEVFTSFGMVVDHGEGSRLSDGRLLGIPLADMGAYELAAYRLTTSGHPWSFDVLTVQVDGPAPGVAALAFGLGGAPEAFNPWGFLLAGPIPSLIILAIQPTGVPFSYALPDVSAYAGATFVLQALAIPNANPSLGVFTNVYRGVLDG